MADGALGDLCEIIELVPGVMVRYASCQPDLYCVGPPGAPMRCAAPVPEGGACVDDPFECESGTTCVDAVCVADRIVEDVGGACTERGTYCEGSRLTCDGASCRERPGPGDPCTAFNPCSFEYFCQDDRCATNLEDGARCTRHAHCGSEYCFENVCLESPECG